VITGFGVFVALYHLVSAVVILQGTSEHYVTHLSLLLILGMLVKFREEHKIRRYVSLCCLFFAIATTIYVFLRSETLLEMGGYITKTDMIVGIFLILTILLASWLWWGVIIPSIIMVFIVYFIWGHLLSGYLYHPHFDFQFCVSALGMSLQDGIFGGMLSVSANMVIYFMIFGAMMEVMGSTKGFLEIGKWIGRYLRGGSAYIAFIGSAAVAMVYGGGAGNVAVTGSFSIPIMKDSGFTPEDAGAIEAVCSQGSQITPPVMGAAAFIMAKFIGVPYVVIMKKAVVGALLYYICTFISINFLCYSSGLRRHFIPYDKRLILMRLPIFLVGLAVILALIIKGYSIGYAGTAAVFTVILVGLCLVPESRSIGNIIDGLERGAIWGAQIGIMLSAMGMVVSTFLSTALAPKLSVTFISFTGGLFLPTLLLIAVMTILLGMGMPVTASYTLAALLMIHTLRKLGVELYASHFFALYFAAWAGLTPPVAAAVMVASRIAESNFWRTGLKSVKIMIAPLLIPFIISVHPNLLDFPFSFSWEQIEIFFLIILASAAGSAFMFNWFVVRLTFLNRALAGVGFLSLMAYILGSGYSGLIVGLIVLIIFCCIQITKWFREKSQQKKL